MAFWDFVKDAGKSVFGSAEAAEPKADPAKTPEQLDTERKVTALQNEVKALGLGSKDVHLRLRGDTVIVESKGADRETMEKLILAVGNIQGIARVEADIPGAPAAQAEAAPAGAGDKGEPVFHTVQKGETLSAIAKKYLGHANRYNDIFEANRPMLSHPDKIYPGQTLRIPR
ncbi:MAG: peptidoglycan-binding protein LysM [Paracoccus sp. (in: a-proteobacteria)]|nr:peptidoglycan-binding protein LysM [Paracoccus sp. (in: a-proteobacteria)]